MLTDYLTRPYYKGQFIGTGERRRVMAEAEKDARTASAGAALRAEPDREARRAAAALMGSARTERKRAAVAANARLGGRPKGFSESEETRRKKGEALRAAWERKRAAGETFARGKQPRPLSEIACTCDGGDTLNHRSTCPRGRAIRRRQKAGTL